MRPLHAAAGRMQTYKRFSRSSKAEHRSRWRPITTGTGACIIALVAGSPGAWAHTNSVGYENAGSGSVNFWYGTYHVGTSFTEGSMELDGPNGFSVTTTFEQLTDTKPDGLVDGETNFYSDGTQLVGTNQGSTVATWQGVNFSDLTAGQYTFTYIPIEMPTAEWDPNDEIIRSSTVFLDAEVVGSSSLIDNATSTSVGTANTLDSLSDSAVGGMDDAITLIQAMDDSSQKAALLRIAPESGAASGKASIGAVTGALDTVAVRIEGIRQQNVARSAWDRINDGEPVLLASADMTNRTLSGSAPSQGQNLWVRLAATDADQGMADGFAGYDADTELLTLGYDTSPTNGWTLGGALSIADTDVSMDDFRSGDNTEIETYQFTGYGTRQFEQFHVDFMLGYAAHGYETRRDTTIAGVARGDFDGEQIVARATVGRPYDLGNGLTFTPRAGLEWNHLSQDAYTESGAGALSMEVDSVSADRVRSMFGARIAKDATYRDYAIRPHLDIGWRHEFDNDGIDTTATFTGGGGAFTTEGQDIQEDTYHVGTGVSVNRSASFAVSLQVDAEYATDYEAYSGQIVAQWSF